MFLPGKCGFSTSTAAARHFDLDSLRMRWCWSNFWIFQFDSVRVRFTNAVGTAAEVRTAIKPSGFDFEASNSFLKFHFFLFALLLTFTFEPFPYFTFPFSHCFCFSSHSAARNFHFSFHSFLNCLYLFRQVYALFHFEFEAVDFQLKIWQYSALMELQSPELLLPKVIILPKFFLKPV